jgi:hypothetical protein
MTKTQLAILWGLGVLIVVILGALGWVLTRGRPPAPAPTALAPAEAPGPNAPAAEPRAVTAPPDDYRLPETPHSARNQYRQAERAAREWQPDARLVSAAATWPFVNLDDLSEAIDWTFQFYSPVTGHVYAVNVGPAGVTPIRDALSPYAVPGIDVEQWQVDSHQALNTWLNRGGGAFLRQHSIADVSIRLARSQASGAAWTVVGVDESGQAVHTERVDAQGPVASP